MKRKRFPAMIACLGLLVLLLAGCLSDDTRGWAPPIVENDTQIVSTTRGKLDGLDASPNPAPAWTGSLTVELTPEQTTLSSTVISPSDTPFQGDLLHIGSEIVRVRSLRVSGTARELQLDRGYAGTLSAPHPAGEEIQAFRRPWRFPDDWFIPEGDARGLDGIYGDPVLADGVVYVGDYGGWVYAFRPQDVRLDASDDNEQPLAAAVELDGKVVGGLALDPASDRLYVTAGGNVYALSAADLRERLASRDAPVGRELLLSTSEEIWAAPAVVEGTVLIASLDGRLYALDGEAGTQQWTFDGNGGLATTPVVAEGLVLAGGFDSELYALDLASGELVWTYATPDWIWSKPVVVDGVAYFGDFHSVVHAVNVEDGNANWSLDLAGGKIRASPAVVGDVAVVGTDDGLLFGIDISEGEVLWQRDLGTEVHADLVAAGDLVLLGPDGCVTPVEGNAEVYYRAVEPATGTLIEAQGAC